MFLTEELIRKWQRQFEEMLVEMLMARTPEGLAFEIDTTPIAQEFSMLEARMKRVLDDGDATYYLRGPMKTEKSE